MARSTKDSEVTKRKILLSAKHEFAEKGFNGARMSSIAEHAGVNQALLHYHFESKENLYLNIFNTVMGDDIDKITVRIREEIKSWNQSPEVELCATIYLMVKGHFQTHDKDLNRIFARDIAENQGVIHDFARKYMMPRIELFDSFIKTGIEKGIFEISNSLMFTLSIVTFISDYIHGEQFIKGTRMHKTLYRNKQETLYNYLLEQSFKTLAPAGKKLAIPVLTDEMKAKLDVFIDEIIELYTI